MKTVYVFLKEPSDAALLRRILPADVSAGVEFVDAGGRGGIPSLARSYLVRRGCPVAVVMDAGSLDPELIKERQQGTEQLIRAAAGSVPVKVVTAVPGIESWFFVAPKAIERVLGQAVPADWLAFGKRDPKGILAALAQRSSRTWDMAQAIRALDEQDVEQIRAIPAVAELNAFIGGAQAGMPPRRG